MTNESRIAKLEATVAVQSKQILFLLDAVDRLGMRSLVPGWLTHWPAEASGEHDGEQAQRAN